MREYGKVSPQFWIGDTGKRLRAAGPAAQVVALYLLTNPHANMLGLYYLPKMFIGHETGLGFEGACKGLQSCIEAGFCDYDDDSETVWVFEMAAFQIADALKPGDLRVKGVQNEYNALPANPYLALFFEKYAGPFHMTEQRGAPLQNAPTEQAPSEPLRSQEQEQEQEQEHLLTPANAGEAGTSVPRPARPNCPHQEIIALYHELLPMGLQVRTWNGDRPKNLQARWREDPKRQSLDWWRKFFTYCAKSEFLTGRAAPARDRDPFVVSLDWLVSPKNFAKTLEGRYHREAT